MEEATFLHNYDILFTNKKKEEEKIEQDTDSVLKRRYKNKIRGRHMSERSYEIYAEKWCEIVCEEHGHEDRLHVLYSRMLQGLD